MPTQSHTGTFGFDPKLFLFRMWLPVGIGPVSEEVSVYLWKSTKLGVFYGSKTKVSPGCSFCLAQHWRSRKWKVNRKSFHLSTSLV